MEPYKLFIPFFFFSLVSSVRYKEILISENLSIHDSEDKIDQIMIFYSLHEKLNKGDSDKFEIKM